MTHACPEYLALSRRGFLRVAGSTAALAAAASAPAWLPRVALARDYRSGQRDVLVSVFLRGASDGLSMCVPWGESAYYAARPTLAVPRADSTDPNRAIDLDGFFGFPQALAPLIPAYQDGNLLVVHATGSTDPSRSHFDAQRYMEVGKANDATLGTGWLGRHLQTTSPMLPGSTLRGVGIATGLQKTLVGGPQTLPIPNLDTFGLTGSAGSRSDRLVAIGNLYDLVPDPLNATAQNTIDTMALLDQIDFVNYLPQSGAVYPTNSTGIAFRSAAALVRAQVGVEAIAIDVSGWDTHAAQGSTTGFLNGLMNSLALSLAAFHRDLFSTTTPSVSVVVGSEFGRQLVENGTQGTDHGHGNCMFVMGHQIDGGRVLRNWPGLATNQLFEGRDLEVTIDYRDILAEIVQTRLGNANLPAIFPGYTPTFRGVTL